MVSGWIAWHSIGGIDMTDHEIIKLVLSELKEHRTESKEQHTELRKELQAQNKRIRSLEDTRNQQRGAWTVMGIVAGVTGAFIGKLFNS